LCGLSAATIPIRRMPMTTCAACIRAIHIA